MVYHCKLRPDDVCTGDFHLQIVFSVCSARLITNVALISGPHRILLLLLLLYIGTQSINPTAITPLKSINTHNIYTLYIMVYNIPTYNIV